MPQLPALQLDPRNALLDLSPVNNALMNIQKQQNANREYDMQQNQLAMQKQSHDLQAQNYQRTWKQQDVENMGKRAMAIDAMADGPQKQAAWQRIVQSHGADGLSPEELDYRTGPKMMAAQAGLFRDPMEVEAQRLKLETARSNLSLNTLKRQQIEKTMAGTGAADPKIAQREELLKRYGVDPSSPEGQMYVFNGKLPSKSYDNDVQANKKSASGQRISEGLQNLNKMADTYNDTAFESSLGPIQGSTPDNLIGRGIVNAARLAGEVSNAFGGGNATPNEVRNNIVGATEALAAAIKPLIRGPGEGVWTDADQARLVSIVGDLSQASTKKEYKRRLNAVRDRVKANFGLEFAFDAVGGMDEASPASPQPQAAQQNVARPQSEAEYQSLPKGAQYTAPDGSVRTKQ